MNKELREMLNSINTMKDEVKALYVEGKDAEANAKMDELDALQIKFENLKKLEDVAPVDVKPVDDRSALDKFADSMRMRFTDMNEGTPAAGGYTVPSDIQTQVNQFKSALVNMETLITVENVSEPTGSRVYQTKAESPAFATVAEAAAIGAGTDPAFTQVTFSCDKRAAIFSATEELLADSDANIPAILADWIAKGDVKTSNTQILAALPAVASATAITDLDGIKNAVNVTLGQTYKQGATIVTNDSGLNYLDTLKDKNGRYVLTPDISNPGQLRFSCGAISLPIFVVPNSILANPAEGSYPFFVGDFKEYMRKYNLQGYTIKNTDVATVNSVSAFENDLVYFKVTERNDFVVIDSAAVVRLTLTPTAQAAAGGEG